MSEGHKNKTMDVIINTNHCLMINNISKPINHSENRQHHQFEHSPMAIAMFGMVSGKVYMNSGYIILLMMSPPSFELPILRRREKK
jgi:hypothetical protein